MKAALPVSKGERIVFLLGYWGDIFSPPVSGYGGSRGDDTPHLSAMSRHPSVVELARCLAALNVEAHLDYVHLLAFHGAVWRTHRWRQTRRRRGGKVEIVDRVERQQLVPGWVDEARVRAAEARLEELFQGPVFIPGELWEALTLSSAEIELRRLRRRGRAAS